MKKPLFILFLLFFSCAVFSQTDTTASYTDTATNVVQDNSKETKAKKVKKKKDKNIKKKGWNFGILPAISYNTDMGFQYGGIIELFDYGDTSYPVYEQLLYAEVSFYTKGSMNNRFYWDTKKLIPKTRMMMDLTYIRDKAAPLFGYNGYASVYHREWIDNKMKDNDDYISRMFYNYSRSFLRFNTDFSWKIGYPKISYFAGVNVLWFKANRVDFKKVKTPYNDTITLYDKYVEWGIIAPAELVASTKTGAWSTHLRIGANFDNRDHEKTPSKGILAEVVFDFAPGFMSNIKGDGFENGYGTFSASFKHFVPLYKDRLVMVYRLALQQKLFGQVPFFLAQNLNTIWLNRIVNEGVGGATTVRGIRKNSVIGDGVAFGNLELRGKVVEFPLLKQNWSLYLNGFADAGMVYQQRKLNPYDHAILNDADYFLDRADGVHLGMGFGIGIVMNRNFIISADVGFPLNKKDGKMGFYMGINFVL